MAGMCQCLFLERTSLGNGFIKSWVVILPVTTERA